jgi:hypothetical protein
METKKVAWLTVIGVSLLLPMGFSRDLQAQGNGTPIYDIGREQNAMGVVETLVVRSGGVTLPGKHLILHTSRGELDVQLGPDESQDANDYRLRSGDQVEVTGCMVIYKGKVMMLARLVKHGKEIIKFRSIRGYPIASRGSGGRSAALRTQ